MDKRTRIANMDVSDLALNNANKKILLAHCFLKSTPSDRLELEDCIFTMKHTAKKVTSFLDDVCKVTSYHFAVNSTKRKISCDMANGKSDNLIRYATHLKELFSMDDINNNSLVKLSSDNHMTKCSYDEVVNIYNYCLDILVDDLK